PLDAWIGLDAWVLTLLELGQKRATDSSWFEDLVRTQTRIVN
ncbi:hypothetical protein V6N11_046746, partial [Hibiscus sabdariffa]